MVAKLFTKPFGVAGDKTPIPNGTQVDGKVSYETGFGADYERQLGVDPAAKNIGRQTFNELMFDVTASLQEMQAGFGTSVYSLTLAQALPGGGYPKGALIPRLAGDGFWLCTTAANTSNPDTGGAGWVQIAAQGSFYAIDTGVANAYSCAFSPALMARSEVQLLAIRIKFTNTGASTINDGLGTVPLVGLAQAALQGGEVAANGVALLQWVAAIASYVVVCATGGAVQAANATKSLQAVNVSQIQSQSVVAFTTTGTATTQVLTPLPAISAYATPQRFNVTFNVASGLNPTINVSAQGAKFLKQYDTTGAKVAAVFAAGQNSDIIYDGIDWILLDQLPNSLGLPYGYFSGLALANNAAAPNTTIDTGPGCARDSTDTVDIKLTATIRGILQSSGAWAAGDNQNKLDTGARANSTTYHLFGIKKTGSGSDDIIYTTNIAGPAMPGGYAGSRYIQSFRTNVSGNIIPFFNRGAWMYYTTPIRDVNLAGQTPGNASTFPLSTPTGMVCEALVYAEIGGDNCALYLSSPDFPDLTPIGIGATYVGGISIQAAGGSALEYSGQQQRIITNASAQIRARYTGQSAVANEIRIVTAGYKVAR